MRIKNTQNAFDWQNIRTFVIFSICFSFTNLEDNDITDVIYFITMSFLGVDNENQYNDCIKQHLINNNVKLNEYDCKIVTDLIREFIIWLKTI